MEGNQPVGQESQHIVQFCLHLLHRVGASEELLHIPGQVGLQPGQGLQEVVGDLSHVEEEQETVADVEAVWLPGSCVVDIEETEHSTEVFTQPWARQGVGDNVTDKPARR